MTSSPKVLLAAQSPAPKIISGPIVLHHHTWYGHIEPNHDVDLQAVNRTIADPCLIAESATVPGDYVLVNQQDVNDFGEALRVPVRPQSTGTNIVTSAYHVSSNFHGKIVWKRGDD